MRTLCIVVAFDAFQDMEQVALTEENHVVESFSDFTNVAFGKGVASGGFGWGLHYFYVFGSENTVKGEEASIPIVDKIVTLFWDIIENHTEISCLLSHPGRTRVGGTSGDKYSACAKVNEEKSVYGNHSTEAPDFLGEEISRPYHIHVGFDELFPAHTFPVRGRWNSVSIQYGTDKCGGNRMAQFFQLAGDPAITPRVFLRHPDNQVFGILRLSGATWFPLYVGIGPLPFLHPSVPGQNRLWLHNRDDFCKMILDPQPVLDQGPSFRIG